ncbi:Kynureninase [Trichinella spiralis]|uniref:Kynureninase n=1 Tax=Trichinella spiralis TaxID=6334 RepID=A0ABR3KHW6_TRISP
MQAMFYHNLYAWVYATRRPGLLVPRFPRFRVFPGKYRSLAGASSDCSYHVASSFVAQSPGCRQLLVPLFGDILIWQVPWPSDRAGRF